MPTISKKELEDYQQLCKDRNNGRILTPDGLRLVCEGLKNDKIAKFTSAIKRLLL